MKFNKLTNTYTLPAEHAAAINKELQDQDDLIALLRNQLDHRNELVEDLLDQCKEKDTQIDLLKANNSALRKDTHIKSSLITDLYNKLSIPTPSLGRITEIWA